MSTLKVDTLQHRDGTEYILSERNKLINGDFQIAQRTASLTSTNSDNNDAKYTLDMWQLFSDGNDIVDVTQETTTVPTNQLYAIALDVETANKKFGIAQKIEQKNCVDLIGQEVTLSFKAKVSSTTNLDNVKCAIIAWDGTADSLTDDMISAWGAEGTDPTLATNYTYENTPANLNLTTSYATYTTTATIDTSGAKNVVVFIWSDVTTTSAGEFLYITDVQLEKGPSNSVFERKSFAQQLFDCQRYYQRYANSTYAVSYTEVGYVGMAFYYGTGDAFLFPNRKGTATMRTTPSNEKSSVAVFDVIGGGTSRDTTNVLADYNNPNINILHVQTSSATDESVARVRMQSSSAEFVAFSAEL